MAVIETWLEQDLQAPVKVRYLDGNLFSNNGNGNRIGVRVYNNGVAVTLSGTVSGYVVVADGSTVPCTGSRSGNQASILIPPAAYQPGAVFISVFLTDGSTVTTLAAVSTTVMQTRTNSQVSPGSVVTDWTQTINAAMQSVETAAANLGGIVAVPYSSITFPVPLGKYTYYNNNLYRCITPIGSSESFTAAHWTQVRLGDDVSDLKSALDSNYLSRYFELVDDTIGAGSEELYLKRLGAIHYIALYGFTAYSKYRLNLIARNHSSYKYRIIIYGYNGSTWVSAFDTGSDFTVTENANGDTLVTKTIGTQTIVMLINYSQMMNSGISFNINNNRYNFTPNVYSFHIEDYATNNDLAQTNRNALERYFILENSDYNADHEDLYFTRFGAIHYIKLIGFDGYQKCRLRLIARNNTSFKYRFIIAGYNGSSWSDVFDAGSNFTVTENTKGDTYVYATSGAKKVIMYVDYSMITNGTSWNESTLTGSYRYIFSDNVYGEDDDTSEEPDIYVLKNATDNIDIVYHYNDTENVMIKFSPVGVNDLFEPHYFYKKTATKIEPVFSGYTAWFTNGTDWVSPYHGIIENDPSVTEGITVGGNHGTNGTSGFPTADRLSITTYMDGKPMELNKVYGGKELKIIVNANIAASNTINMETGAFDPAMLETVVWTVTKNNIEVAVYLKALKNISIKGYTGLQMTPTANPAVYFNDGTGQKTINSTTINSQMYPGFTGNRNVLLDTVSGDLRIVYTNRGVGIGDLSHIGNGNPVSYVSSNNKLYQHLVNVPLDLSTGETAMYSGGYTFMQSYTATGAKEAYFIRLNGKNTYCVDFLESGSCYAELPPECIGHQIEVIEKDSTITIDPIVSGNGIHVVSTGIGSVWFKVK